MKYKGNKYMKKLFILIILALGLSGCIKCEETPEYDKAWAKHGNCITTKVIQIEGHRYIILCGYYDGTIIHSESCECKK
jgi:hypothetical protein